MAIERTFVGGKMVVAFPNGRTREVTVEQLETRKANVPTMIAKRAENMDKMVERLTARIAAEEDATKKAKMEERLVKVNERKNSLPTGEEITGRLQGWIDEANASA